MKLTILKTWLSSRARKVPVTTIVLHGTAGTTVAGSLSWLRQIGLSYHYVIDRDGSVTKAVPTGRVAYHAGVSSGPNGKNVNDYSIGIAFANKEDGKEAITIPQIDAARLLVKELTSADKNIKWLTRHKDVSPGRKSDPKMMDDGTLRFTASFSGISAWVYGGTQIPTGRLSHLIAVACPLSELSYC